jgi:hypothetical protein
VLLKARLLLPPIGTPSSDEGKLEKDVGGAAVEETVSVTVPVEDNVPALPVKGKLREPEAKLLAVVKTW